MKLERITKMLNKFTAVTMLHSLLKKSLIVTKTGAEGRNSRCSKEATFRKDTPYTSRWPFVMVIRVYSSF